MNMKSRWIAGLGATFCLCLPMVADTITLNNGGQVQGIITKIESGKVTVQLTADPGVTAVTGTREVDLKDVGLVNFDTPHLTEGTAKLPLDHFLRDLDAQEMVRMGRDLKQAREDSRRQLDQIKAAWAIRQPVDKDQVRRWEAAKETFSAPLSRYRELVQDMYFHVLSQIDGYNKLTTDAEKVYVGVKGVFNVGSPLIPQDLDELSIKQSVPKNWYDKIFYEGYNRGYREGSDFERLTRVPPAAAAGESPR